MSVQQLALDVLAAVRAAGVSQQHRRGYVRLPHGIWGHPAGDVVPAWVCCRCGGVEVNEYVYNINHGCCRLGCPPCTVRSGRRGPRDPGPFDAHWIPERPR